MESEDGNYAEYTLTVTAGKKGCPQVRVVDHFTANSDFVSYLRVGSEAETLTSTGSPGETIAVGKAHGTVCIDASGDLVWEIGDMTANETRTLRYRVKLGENYTYLQNSEEKLISNEAQAYAAQYPKENSTANLEPKAGRLRSGQDSVSKTEKLCIPSARRPAPSKSMVSRSDIWSRPVLRTRRTSRWFSSRRTSPPAGIALALKP